MQIPEALTQAGWVKAPDGKSMEKTFKFKGFRSAMSWMMRAAFEAEAINHHPEWFNVYNRVEVRLTTHDTGGLSAKDIELAERFERI